MANRIRGIVLLFFCLFLLPTPTSAQIAYTASLSTPNLDAFPRIELYLDVHDLQGDFVHGLQANQIGVLEDGLPAPVTELSELRPGVQFVVAIDPGPSMGVRDSQGISRYDEIKSVLADWAISRQGSNLDDWSLLITGGPEISHTQDAAKWLEALKKDQVNARSAIPNLDTLSRAINLAADASARPGMGRVVLFITQPPEGQASQSLENLASQARQQGVSIYIWMVSSTGAFPTIGVQRLTDLAGQTGGSVFAYTGGETLPNPEEYLAQLRFIYKAAYQSNLKTSGDHQLVVQVQLGVDQIETNPQNFPLEIIPPQPAFVAPPIQIIRKAPTQDNPANENQEASTILEPTTQALQVVFDYPDGRKRDIVHTALLVDGAIVAENSEPPYDQFTWKIDSYLSDGTHTLQVQATDNLGMTGTSLEIPVRIKIERTASNYFFIIRRNLPILTTFTVILTGAILLLVLILGGRLRPRALRGMKSRDRKVDPLTQAVPIQNEPAASHLPGWVNRLQWPQRHVTPQAYAYLNRISNTDEPVAASPIPISSDEITLGSNPNQATLVIDDPSVEPLHARLTRSSEGIFRLSDEGSIAGTWINYAPVSQGGVTLVHGDLIHIGRMGFRFTLRKPGQVRKPVVTLQTPTQVPDKEQQS